MNSIVKCVLVILCCFIFGSATCQELSLDRVRRSDNVVAREFKVGERVRIYSSGKHIKGTITAIDSGFVELSPENSNDSTEIIRIEPGTITTVLPNRARMATINGFAKFAILPFTVFSYYSFKRFMNSQNNYAGIEGALLFVAYLTLGMVAYSAGVLVLFFFDEIPGYLSGFITGSFAYRIQ